MIRRPSLLSPHLHPFQLFLGSLEESLPTAKVYSILCLLFQSFRHERPIMFSRLGFDGISDGKVTNSVFLRGLPSIQSSSPTFSSNMRQPCDQHCTSYSAHERLTYPTPTRFECPESTHFSPLALIDVPFERARFRRFSVQVEPFRTLGSNSCN